MTRSAISRSQRPRRRQAAIALATAALAVGLAACTGAANDSESSDGQIAPGAAGASQSDSGDAKGEAAGVVDQTVLTSVADVSKQIVTGSITVQTDSVLTAARRVAGIAVAAGGLVTDEQTSTGGPMPLEDKSTTDTVSTLTIRVPPDAYDTTIASISDLGHLVSQSRTTADVTDEYVDVQARITSQETSLDRLLALVNTAAQLDDVLALENEIARRQSDLDALKARIASLDSQVDLSTIVVTLTDETDIVAAASRTGFLGGLERGWNAFADATEAGLTAIGAVLPFAVLFGLLYLAGRPIVARYRRRSGSPTIAPASTGSDAG